MRADDDRSAPATFGELPAARALAAHEQFRELAVALKGFGRPVAAYEVRGLR